MMRAFAADDAALDVVARYALPSTQHAREMTLPNSDDERRRYAC